MDCEFEERVSFRGTIFREGGRFDRCTFSKDVDFVCAVFQDITTFFEAHFAYSVCFWDAVFEASAQFNYSSFQFADFTNATFRKFASFSNVNFNGRVRFRNVRFERGAICDGTSFRYAYDEASLFLAIWKGWEDTGNVILADRYFYKYLVAERKQKPLIVQMLEFTLVDLTCAYGTSWERVVGTWGVVILVSTLIFWLGKGIEHADHEGPIRSISLSLYFSIVTFTTLGYGDYRPRGKYKILASIVAMAGAFMMALFVAVFVRRFMR